MDMKIRSTNKNGDDIVFDPKGRGARYTVNGVKKKGVTTIIGERFGTVSYTHLTLPTRTLV